MREGRRRARFRSSGLGGVLLAALLLSLALPAWAGDEEDETCLECHDDVVEAQRWLLSVHGKREDFGCTACHQDVELNADFEHETPVEAVDCAGCHEDVAELQAASVHGVALAAGDEHAPQCWDCHGSHYMRKASDPASPTNVFNIPSMCGSCHREGSPVSRDHDIGQDHILQHYSQSIHGTGVFEKGLTVTAVCTSCHTAHDIRPHTDPKSSVHPDNVAATCRQCHGRIENVHSRVIEGRLWEEEPGRIPVCVDCHAPHEQRLKGDLEKESLYQARVRNQACTDCHASDAFKTKTMERDGKAVSLYVDVDRYYAGSHGKAGKACSECHSGVTRVPKVRACETIQTKVDCAACHADQVSQHARSAHGKQAELGDPDAPTCLDCHDKHGMQSHNLPTSPTFARNVPALCARCHREGGQAAVRLDSEVPIVESYEMSIHGTGLTESGLLVTATCIDCHTAHMPLPTDDPESSVHDDRIASTCGTCHHGIEEQFLSSIHGPGNTATDKRLPTCRDCHTSHAIRRKDRDDFRLMMTDQCGGCHQAETETFFATVHGQSSNLGSARSAKCHDCHGSHAILPPSDPASTLSHQNVVETCSQCHQAAHRQFAGYLTHATHHDPVKYPWLFWTFWGMTALLIGTLTVSLLHTGAWLVRLMLTKGEWSAHKALAKPKPGEKQYRRFDRYARTQHMLMILSFFVLAITGMVLKFSYAAWAQSISTVVSFDAMSTLHRLGAVVLFGVFVVHLVYLRRKRKRRKQSVGTFLFGQDSILFNRRDLKEAKQAVKWFFGRGPRPRFGRYTYWEKFDYLAVFWGIAVIGLTGLLRWFPEFFTHLVPGWFINVAAIVHSDEALLAVGFIFTIHFFNTHFRPDKFPMDPVIFTGRVTVDELKYDRPREYEAAVKSGDLERRLVEPFPEGATKVLRIFGFIALGIGLALIAFIVYTMIWTYT